MDYHKATRTFTVAANRIEHTLTGTYPINVWVSDGKLTKQYNFDVGVWCTYIPPPPFIPPPEPTEVDLLQGAIQMLELGSYVLPFLDSVE